MSKYLAALFSPSRLLILSIIFTITIGTALLSLPIAQTRAIPLIDVFFTATSTMCVCGLSTVPLSEFSFFGQCIILILMQIGGLSLITVMLFFMSFFIKFGFRTQLLGGQFFELESWTKFKTILLFTVGFTAVVECLGAIVLFLNLITIYSFKQAIFFSIFHAVSLFCNAGLCLFPDSMELFRHNYILLATSAAILLIAGFGFFAWYDVFLYIKSFNKKKYHHVSLHTKIVSTMTAISIISSFLLYWILEQANTLQSMTLTEALINTFFNSTANRVGGFYTINIINLQLATLLVNMVNSFIGGSPGSTSSGVKSTTIALTYGIIKATIADRTSITLKGRTIPKDLVFRAVSILCLSILVILCTTFCLLITEQGISFLAVLFEAVSAYANLGLTLGITPYLSSIGKCFIILCMLIGRIGSLGFIFAIQQKRHEAGLSYPEERIMLG